VTMRAYIALCGALLCAACYQGHGPAISNFEPAQGPRGIDADLRLQNRHVLASCSRYRTALSSC